MPNQGKFWCVPVGGINSEESLIEGLERELVEELGVKPEVGELLHIQQYKTDKREYLDKHNIDYWALHDGEAVLVDGNRVQVVG
jgi:ADP-ribose pyrophosphatase YjhB (NUDIX family)